MKVFSYFTPPAQVTFAMKDLLGIWPTTEPQGLW